MLVNCFQTALDFIVYFSSFLPSAQKKLLSVLFDSKYEIFSSHCVLFFVCVLILRAARLFACSLDDFQCKSHQSFALIIVSLFIIIILFSVFLFRFAFFSLFHSQISFLFRRYFCDDSEDDDFVIR